MTKQAIIYQCDKLTSCALQREGRTGRHSSGVPAKITGPESNHDEIADKLKLRDSL